MKNPKGELFSYPPNSQVRSQSGHFSTRARLRFAVRYLSVTLLTHTWNNADIDTGSKSSTVLQNPDDKCCCIILFCFNPLWPSSQSPATCTVPTWAFPYPYRNMAAAPFPIMLCLHLTHQTVAVPAARAPAQITTRQLIELFFSSQAGGHCKNIPTLEYGFLVQVRPPGGKNGVRSHSLVFSESFLQSKNTTNNCVYRTCVSNNKSQPYNLFGCEGCIVLAVYSRGIARLLVADRDSTVGPAVHCCASTS